MAATSNRRNPWQHLPDFVADLILERLPLSDNMRFSAVCRQWRAIQKDRRLRCHPHSPPMLPVPWLLLTPDSCAKHESQQRAVICYSPFERRLYRLPCFNQLMGWTRAISSLCGWLILRTIKPEKSCNYEQIHTLTLVNPITGLTFQFPQIKCLQAAMSPPGQEKFFVLAASWDHLFLIRPGCDTSWTKLYLPAAHQIRSITYCNGKFYCIINGRFIVVHPLSCGSPTVEYLDMDISSLDSDMEAFQHFLMEVDGEVWLLELIKAFGLLDFTLPKTFKADLSKKMWVRMGSVGDRMLLHSWCSCQFSFADDVKGKKNYIYFAGQYVDDQREQAHERYSSLVFDLGVGKLMDEQLPILNTASGIDVYSNLSWIVPSLDHVNLLCRG